MTYEDKVLNCTDENCQTHTEGLEPKQFIWTAGEQEFYAERNMSEPKRCKGCRDARKASMNRNRRNFDNNYNN